MLIEKRFIFFSNFEHFVIYLQWEPVDNAVGYVVSNNETGRKYEGIHVAMLYIPGPITAGKDYKFGVLAYDLNNVSDITYTTVTMRKNKNICKHKKIALCFY